MSFFRSETSGCEDAWEFVGEDGYTYACATSDEATGFGGGGGGGRGDECARINGWKNLASALDSHIQATKQCDMSGL